MQEVNSIPSTGLSGDIEDNIFDLKSICFLCGNRDLEGRLIAAQQIPDGTVRSLEFSKDAYFILRTFDYQCSKIYGKELLWKEFTRLLT